MDIINFKNFSWQYKGYRNYSLKEINLNVKKGEFIGITGSVGAGRSTLCMAILGLVPHLFPGKIKGELLVKGLNTEKTKIAELSKIVGLVLQSPETQITGAGVNVEEELAFGLQNLGVPREEMKKRVNDMIKMVGLEEFRKRNPYELSGGQQQKVAIASVLIMNPEILVLDEPTAKLDPLGTSQVFEFVKKLSKKGITIILNTHKLEYLAEFADRVVIMNDSQLTHVGEAKKVLTDINLLEKNNIIPPVFTRLSEELIKEKLYKGEKALTLNEAEKIIKKVMKK